MSLLRYMFPYIFPDNPPHFLLVGQGQESDSFELIPWSEEAKSGAIACTTPASIGSYLGRLTYATIGMLWLKV